MIFSKKNVAGFCAKEEKILPGDAKRWVQTKNTTNTVWIVVYYERNAALRLNAAAAKTMIPVIQTEVSKTAGCE